MDDINAPFPVVVEGPDGSGKTSLIKKLRKDLNWKLAPRFSTSTGGPVDDLYRKTMANMSRPSMAIYDRHPSVSEAIYAMSLERPLDPAFLSIKYYRARALFYTGNTEAQIPGARLILCLPPKKVIRQNLKVEEQLKGVDENIESIIHFYKQVGRQVEAGQWPGWSYVYDYTQPHAYELLKENLCQT